MFSTPTRNLHNYVKTRPPEILTAICLLIFGFSLLYYSYYIRYVEKVLNSDAQEDWSSLFKYLNKRNYCFTNRSIPINKIDDNFFTRVNVPTRITFGDVLRLQAATIFFGTVQLKDFTPICLESPPPEEINLMLNVSQLLSNDNYIDVCMSLFIPINTTKQFRHPECQIDPVKTTIAAQMISEYPNVDTFCKGGVKSRIMINEGSGKQIKIYLSEDERMKIRTHLLWLTIFVFFILIIMICCAMFTRPSNNHT